MDPQLQELLDGAAAWASARKRPLDATLLGQALDLRVAVDQFADTWWPAWTVRRLMVECYPGHGPVEPPDPDVLTATLDSYWRFLRSTGRMSAASAPPAELVAQAKSCRRAMARACVEADNVLRRQALAEQRARMAQPMPAARAAECAPQVRSSGLWRHLTALVDWLGEGRPVDQDNQLLLADAQDLYRALDLGRWMHHYLELANHEPGEAFGQVDRSLPWNPQWRQPADCVAVGRLWWVAVRTGIVECSDGLARAVRPMLATDEEWVAFGDGAVAAMAEWADWDGLVDPLLAALSLLTGPRAQPRSLAELVEHWVVLDAADASQLPDAERREELLLRALDMTAALAAFADAGLWTRDGEVLTGTAFGWEASVVVDGGFVDGDPGEGWGSPA